MEYAHSTVAIAIICFFPGALLLYLFRSGPVGPLLAFAYSYAFWLAHLLLARIFELTRSEIQALLILELAAVAITIVVMKQKRRQI